MVQDTKNTRNQLTEICGACGRAYGYHKAKSDQYGPRNMCPPPIPLKHVGRIAGTYWKKSPGTTFWGTRIHKSKLK